MTLHPAALVGQPGESRIRSARQRRDPHHAYQPQVRRAPPDRTARRRRRVVVDAAAPSVPGPGSTARDAQRRPRATPSASAEPAAWSSAVTTRAALTE